MPLRTALTIAAGATLALAAWTAFLPRSAPVQATPANAPAPVNRDYLRRDVIIAFEEQEAAGNQRDQITSRMLAAQYMQRFRERGDPGDIFRAESMARRSIRLQPQGNTAAQAVLASALLSVHDFRNAIAHERDAIAGEPFDDNARAQLASLLMETGDYARAADILRLRPRGNENPTWDAVLARYQELSGRLSQARATIARAANILDGMAYAGAYDRSWYHVRAGQLAFEDGDFRSANFDYRQALSLFPDNSTALLWQARLYRAERRWQPALRSATRSADIYPLPQALGYKADAQRALGDRSGAHQTDELIRAEQRLFNVQGMNDRLLATYYVQRGTYLPDALRAARADFGRRGDEVYADDTLAWTLAALKRWREARVFSERAVRLGTPDSQLEYHAAVIALHLGYRREALARLHDALARNPRFDPFDAPAALRDLSFLERTVGAGDR